MLEKGAVASCCRQERPLRTEGDSKPSGRGLRVSRCRRLGQLHELSSRLFGDGSLGSELASVEDRRHEAEGLRCTDEVDRGVSRLALNENGARVRNREQSDGVVGPRWSFWAGTAHEADAVIYRYSDKGNCRGRDDVDGLVLLEGQGK